MLTVSRGGEDGRTGRQDQAEHLLGLTLERYMPLIIRVCRKRLRGSPTRDIEDAVLETALQYVAGGYAIPDPETWLVTLAVRTWSRTVRSRVRATARSAAAVQRKSNRTAAAPVRAPGPVEPDSGLIAERYWPLVARLCRARLRGLRSSDIEDAIQETFLRLAEADRSRIVNIEAWLTTVAIRSCARVLRLRYRARETPVSHADTDPLADAITDADERLWFAKVAALMPTADVKLLHMLYVQDKSYDEVAKYFNMSGVNARVRAYRARQNARLIIDRLD